MPRRRRRRGNSTSLVGIHRLIRLLPRWRRRRFRWFHLYNLLKSQSGFRKFQNRNLIESIHLYTNFKISRLFNSPGSQNLRNLSQGLLWWKLEMELLWRRNTVTVNTLAAWSCKPLFLFSFLLLLVVSLIEFNCFFVQVLWMLCIRHLLWWLQLFELFQQRRQWTR